MAESANRAAAGGCLRSLLVGLVVVVAAGVVIGTFASDENDQRADQRAEIAAEATLSACGLNDSGLMAAVVQVENGSSERSNYRVKVAFESADGSEQIDTATARVSGLKPEQTATDEAVSFEDPVEGFKCEVLEVSRTSDE